MIKIGYFCTAGYTEVGGIRFFLDKINPNVNWEPCFPKIVKANLKLGRMNSTPVIEQNGVSGSKLIEEMFSRLEKYYTNSDFDGFLLIDDLDCRFSGAITQGLETFEEFVQQEIKVIMNKEVKFYAMFASPEIEAWLISDWNNSFAKEYPQLLSHKLLKSMKDDLLKEYWDNNIETYGGQYKNGSCEEKISEKIQELFLEIGVDEEGKVFSYSKQLNGPEMLKRIQPQRVSEKCNICFRNTYLKLNAL